VNLAAGTDCPVEAPDAAAVYAGFVRREDGKEAETLTPEEALHAFTAGADRSLGLEGGGCWVEGANADFLILRPDASWPLEPEIPLPIERVVVGGRGILDLRAPGSEDPNPSSGEG
jgi:predicted amidohydrolase YtcJ